MSLVTMAARELFDNRTSQVKAMLAPLKSAKPLHCEPFPGQVRGGKAFVAHDGLSPREDYRDYPFRLKDSQLECTYNEVWLPVSGASRWVLVRAYLTLFVINLQLRESEQLLCVHCDPADESHEPTRSYKIGPHLHLAEARPPLPRCHFPLCLTNLDEVLRSPKSLTEALRKTAEVLQNEVVARFAEGR